VLLDVVDPSPTALHLGRDLDRLTCRVEGRRLVLERKHRTVVLHPMWVRERSTSSGAVDPHNRQRLTEPLDHGPGLGVVAAAVVVGCPTSVDVAFTDGHRMQLTARDIADAFGDRDPDAPPRPTPWSGADIDVPIVNYSALTSVATIDATMAATLDSFFQLGFFLLRGTPAVPGALHEITSYFGRISATNFGALFDVRSDPVPIDLAYTPVALTAHTDQPYRQPVPGLQFLHTIANDAPGGSSTIVDGLAAVNELALADPEAFEVLSTLLIEFRYDIGTDVKIASAPLIDLHPDGSLRQLRYSPRLDYAPAADPEVLDIYYRGRRWLAEQLNSPSRRIELRMGAGDVLVVDNHRVLHGRSSFDPTRGHRHLQGCYIDHDGPETQWRLARRRHHD
jgi:gamma-butyrobetaine dioxygenase